MNLPMRVRGVLGSLWFWATVVATLGGFWAVVGPLPRWLGLDVKGSILHKTPIVAKGSHELRWSAVCDSRKGTSSVREDGRSSLLVVTFRNEGDRPLSDLRIGFDPGDGSVSWLRTNRHRHFLTTEGAQLQALTAEGREGLELWPVALSESIDYVFAVACTWRGRAVPAQPGVRCTLVAKDPSIICSELVSISQEKLKVTLVRYLLYGLLAGCLLAVGLTVIVQRAVGNAGKSA